MSKSKHKPKSAPKSAAQPARRPGAASAARRPQPVSLRRMLPVLLTGGFLLGIFFLPYYVPLHTPSASQSWEFGFNNTVAQGLIALMLLSLFGCRYFLGRGDLAGDPVSVALDPEPEAWSPRPLLGTMVLLQALACIILLVWYNILPTTHYGEFTYFIQRVEAVLLGHAPYVDFAFDYGPAMLALPVSIYRLFHGAVSVEAAYAAALVIHFVIGFALLAYVVSQLNARWRALILALAGIQWVNLTMGLQYTPLRFTIAPASLFAIRHIHRLTRDLPSRRMLLLALAGFLFPLLSFSISPEMGLALTVSLCVYFFWFLFGPERALAILILPVLAGVGVAVLLFPRPYFDSMLSFGEGGANFPIFPTIHILAFLAAAIWVLPRLGIIAVRDKLANGPFCAGLAFLFGLLIVPATGRCDPGHIWINSLGLLTVALAAVSWLRPKWRYTLWGLYFVIFPLTCDISFWDHYQQPIDGALAIRHELLTIPYSPDNYAHLAPGAPLPPIHYSKLLPMNGLDNLPKVKIGLPLGDNETIERYLKLNGRDIPEYHIPPYGDVFGAADLEDIYKDLRSMEYVFVPTLYLNYIHPPNPALQMRAQGEADCKFLSSLLLFPVDLEPVHPLFQPDADIIRRIAQEYVPYKQYQSGVLLKRKDAAP